MAKWKPEQDDSPAIVKVEVVPVADDGVGRHSPTQLNRWGVVGRIWTFLFGSRGKELSEQFAKAKTQREFGAAAQESASAIRTLEEAGELAERRQNLEAERPSLKENALSLFIANIKQIEEIADTGLREIALEKVRQEHPELGPAIDSYLRIIAVQTELGVNHGTRVEGSFYRRVVGEPDDPVPVEYMPPAKGTNDK